MRVNTSFGMTETAAKKEIVAKGLIGETILNLVTLDKTISSSFSGSAEIRYL